MANATLQHSNVKQSWQLLISGSQQPSTRNSRDNCPTLSYVNDFDEGITRRRCGRGFTYLSPGGRTIRSKRTRQRIEDLVIPPAWEDVWICPDERGHIQARGRDEAGRTQYLYHVDWRAVRDMAKFDRMLQVAEVLPRIRRRVRRDLNRQRLSRERVLAAVVRLLDKAQLRVGNRQSQDARGATTLRTDDADLDGFRVSLDFPGKSGKRREVAFSDRKVARVIRQCEEIEGQYLFGYRHENGDEFSVDSSQVNDYLQTVADEQVTAKDFRTWWGSVTAMDALSDLSIDADEKTRKSACVAAVKSAAETLGNTPAVCRKSYIHPGILSAAESGELAVLLAELPNDNIVEMTQAETRFFELLKAL